MRFTNAGKQRQHEAEAAGRALQRAEIDMLKAQRTLTAAEDRVTVARRELKSATEEHNEAAIAAGDCSPQHRRAGRGGGVGAIGGVGAVSAGADDDDEIFDLFGELAEMEQDDDDESLGSPVWAGSP